MPSSTRRRIGPLALLAACAAVAFCLPSAARAADDASWPSKPVRIVVPFPPGGAADVFARLIGDFASKSLGQTFVVDNRPGAGGQIATDFVAKAPADGYTFLVVTVGHAVNPSVYSKLPYDTQRDLTGVARIADLPSVLVVNPSVQANNVRELVELMRAKPGALAFASAGNATTSHVAGAMLTSLAKVDSLHVSYKGSAPAVTDLISGQVQWMIDPILSSAQHVRSGKLRALAVSTAKRSSLVPDLPTITDAGVPGYDFAAWFLLLAPAKTPAAIVSRMNQEVARIVTTPEAKERYATLGAEPGSGSPEAVNAFIASEIRRYAVVAREANMKAD